MITAPHTLAHWPEDLYMPSPVIDRKNRETWQRDGEKSLWARAVDEVERRLAGYHPIETDSAADTEMRHVIRSGMRGEAILPLVPPAAEPYTSDETAGRRPRMRQRRAQNQAAL